MFFPASKLFWLVAAPSNLLALLALVGLLMTLRPRWRRAGSATAALGLGLLIVAGLSPLATLATLPLEERFPAFSEDGQSFAGIIVLGGAVEARPSMRRGQLLVNDAAERVIAMADLARRYPEARVVFTGGPPNDDGGLASEAVALERFAGALGLAPGRVTYEARSRNTRENALFTAALAPPRPGERWLLVTSAFHVPRAVGCFRAAGYAVVAYPVDYRTISALDRDGGRTVSDGLALLDLATREWIGLLAYRLAGYTDALWPGP